MTRTWAVEHAKIGVTINVTIPGLGELVEKVDRGEPVPEKVRRGGLGAPDDPGMSADNCPYHDELRGGRCC
jgi:hypothetical protein